MVVTAQHLATQVGVDVLKRRRQRGRRRRRGGLRAGGGLSGGGQSRRRRLHDDPARRWSQDVPRLPREGAAGGDARHVSRRATATSIADLSTRGHLAVAVPGTVSGLEYAREKYGTMQRAALDRARDLAGRARLRARSGRRRHAARGHRRLPQGPRHRRRSSSTTAQPFAAGETLVQKDLARHAAQHQRNGAPTASTRARSRAAIVASSQAGKGIITQADLDQYATRELAPVECDYRGFRIVSAPPPSSGGVVICEMLNVLEGYPLRGLGFGSAQARALPDRGDAPRLRGPQQLPRRSGRS